MQEHLNKPIEVEKLYETLLKYISKKVDKSNVTLENKDNINIPTFINIDTKVGLSHMANNKRLYLKILNDFKSNYKDVKLENLEDKELERVAHTIKGLSANIGANNLSEIAKEIEQTLNKDLFERFYKELNLVIDELENLIQNTTKKNLLEISSTKRDELFSSLKEFAQKRRAREIKKVIEELESYGLKQEDRELLDRIVEYLSKRDYTSIVEKF
jgi:HPt (histidine-containing phosphotransfer) domain-containing protein